MLEMLHQCLEYREMGFSLLPLKGKKPAIAWKPLTIRRPTLGELYAWFGHLAEKSRCPNVGIICGHISGIIALDADSEELARTIASKLPKSDMMTKTAKGLHIFYRIKDNQTIPSRVRIAGTQLDIRGECSYVVAAPSIHPETGQRYEKVETWKPDGVPYFEETWIEEVLDGGNGNSFARTAQVEDGRGYIAHIQAVSGEGGHNATFRAACKLRDAGLSEAEALAELIDWNGTNADPPWTVKELLHKVKDAFSYTSRV